MGGYGVVVLSPLLDDDPGLLAGHRSGVPVRNKHFDPAQFRHALFGTK